MLRKTILALAASAALGAAVLLPAAASAAPGHGGWHGGWSGGWHAGYVRPGFRVYAGPVYGTCVVRRWIDTPYGPVLRWVNICY